MYNCISYKTNMLRFNWKPASGVGWLFAELALFGAAAKHILLLLFYISLHNYYLIFIFCSVLNKCILLLSQNRSKQIRNVLNFQFTYLDSHMLWVMVWVEKQLVACESVSPRVFSSWATPTDRHSTCLTIRSAACTTNQQSGLTKTALKSLSRMLSHNRSVTTTNICLVSQYVYLITILAIPRYSRFCGLSNKRTD